MSTSPETNNSNEVAVKITSRSETGHPINVAKFDELIANVLALGATYNPSKLSIKIAALQTASTAAKSALSNVDANWSVNNNAIAARDMAIEPMSRLVTRIVNSLDATDVPQAVKESARAINRKIQGVRTSAKKTDTEKAALAAQNITVNEISTSQMSATNRIENLDKLSKLLMANPLYAPNEPDLKTAAIVAYLNDLKTKTALVNSTAVTLNNARIQRNDVLYKSGTGICDLAADVKSYTKSLLGTTNPQFKAINAIKFKAR